MCETENKMGRRNLTGPSWGTSILNRPKKMQMDQSCPDQRKSPKNQYPIKLKPLSIFVRVSYSEEGRVRESAAVGSSEKKKKKTQQWVKIPDP